MIVPLAKSLYLEINCSRHNIYVDDSNVYIVQLVISNCKIAGVENSVKTLENFLEIDINYYTKANFTSLI